MTAVSRFKLGASAVALLAVVGANGAYAQNTDSLETVTVTGYRASLEKAIDLKRSAADSSDSILAEDIGKFPDMNVTESLQRIPGVAINREAGEGREITVRGLGAQFTRVRLNGIEAVATVGSQDVSTSNPGNGAGGTNRGRSFDFNVFASELFTQLTVHKSNSASIEEGSLGATVDLHTARPFDHPGFVLTASAQGQYQELSGSLTPRLAALVSDTFAGGKLGLLFSAAYQGTNTLEEGTSSVRWMSDLGNGATYYPQYNPVPPNTGTNVTSNGTNNNRIGSVNGTACSNTLWETNAQRVAAAPSGATSGTLALPAACSDFNMAFRPRFPRYDVVNTHSKRLGLTASAQFQPDENTLFTLDALYADFSQARNEYYLEANSFSTSGIGSITGYVDNTTTPATNRWVGSQGARVINILSYQLGGTPGMDTQHIATNTVVEAKATNVGMRNERRLDHLDTRFFEATLDGSHSFSDNFKVHMLLGWTESHHRNPVQTTLAADLGCTGTGTAPTASATNIVCGAGTTTDPYEYDYSQGNIPMLSTGNVDPTSTNGWFLANVRERQQFAYNSYRSIAFDTEWKPNSAITITSGFDYRNYGYYTYETRRSTGGTGEASTIPDSIRSVPLSNYTTTVSLRGIPVPDGSNTSWFTFDFDKAASAIKLWDPATFPLNVAPGITNSGRVRENDYSGWLQAGWDSDLLGMSFRGDVGVRYVLTESKSVGYTYTSTGVAPIEAHNVYHDWLPALNAVLEPFENFQVRFGASYAMSRPVQGAFIPSGAPSVSGTNFNVSVGNPQLPPMRSKNLDLSFEYYYGKGSMISVAGFWKHLDNFTQAAQFSGLWSDNPFGFDAAPFVAACGGTGSNFATVPTSSNCYNSGHPELVNWTFSRQVSVKGAPLYGTEINWQQQFDFLPAPFDSFGVAANYTYVQAQQSFYSGGANPTFLMKADLNNMSRNTYNTTVYYDDQVFQARMSAVFRSHYLVDPNITTNYRNFGIWAASTFNLDAAASYKVDDKFMVTFDALNLTNQASNIYADAFAKRSYQYHYTGTVYFAGVKYTY